MGHTAIYIHVPFCRHRCAYCDFNTYAGIEETIPAYIDALTLEIEFIARRVRGLAVQTVYFGGGTPSLLPVKDLERLISTLKRGFEIAPDVEVTVEANPGTVSLNTLGELRQLGVNRLSLGMQSANPHELQILERPHDFIDVIEALQWARKVGFDNINLDLIYGLPGQRDGQWQSSLTSALGLQPEHVSMYALGLEQGTPMYGWVERGLLAAPDPDQAAEMYEWGSQELVAGGYAPYELSAWAKINAGEDMYECRHNKQYWRNQPYLGFGAGAHGFAGGLRVANVNSPFEYIKRMAEGAKPGPDIDKFVFPSTPATSQVEKINKQVEMQETMMLGLRLLMEGVSKRRFEDRFQRSVEDVFGEEIELLLGNGLVEWAGDDILRLSRRGRLLGNQVFVEFV